MDVKVKTGGAGAFIRRKQRLITVHRLRLGHKRNPPDVDRSIGQIGHEMNILSAQ
jgi:hypothetical protein